MDPYIPLYHQSITPLQNLYLPLSILLCPFSPLISHPFLSSHIFLFTSSSQLYNRPVLHVTVPRYKPVTLLPFLFLCQGSTHSHSQSKSLSISKLQRNTYTAFEECWYSLNFKIPQQLEMQKYMH